MLDNKEIYEMYYLTHLFLGLLLLTCPANTTSTKIDSGKLEGLCNLFRSHVEVCSETYHGAEWHTCPSHLWSEIMQNLVPVGRRLGAWIRQRIGADAAFWYPLVGYAKTEMAKCDMRELAEIKDEAITWILLNRHLKFDRSKSDSVSKCLLLALRSLRGEELAQVSKLEYNGDRDMFDEINEIVNDPRKARLLDGLKRASRDDAEMSDMIAHLNRWVGRPQRNIGAAILHTAFVEELEDLSVERLRARDVGVPNLQDPELAGLFRFLLSPNVSGELAENESFFEDSVPPSFPYHNYLITFLTQLYVEARSSETCQAGIQIFLRDFRDSTDWRDVLSFNLCAMRGLSRVPDEFFEEYAKLTGREQFALSNILRKAHLPVVQLF